MSIALISHPDCLLHEMNAFHPEQSDRLRVIEAALAHSSLKAQLKHYAAPLVTREQLLRVHQADYIDHIFEIAPKQGLVAIDPDTLMGPHTLQAALRAAGSTVQAVDLVMKNEVSAAFCNVRPPGHHAERARAMGFCFFNNVAVGVAHALEHYKLERVAIIDFDVHHGNGTENIFQHDNRVLLCSSFQHPFYPYVGAETKSDHIINVPLLPGTSGKEFLTAVMQPWLKAVNEFKPNMIFFSAGFDAHADDELANLMLEEEDYAAITRLFKQVADLYCKGRIVSALEGGYSLKALGPCVVAHLQALISDVSC